MPKYFATKEQEHHFILNLILLQTNYSFSHDHLNIQVYQPYFHYYFVISILQINFMISKLISYRIFTGSKAIDAITALMFQPEKQLNKSIKTTELPISDLVPDFFTKDIQCFELSQIHLPSKSSNTPSNSFVRFKIPLGTNTLSRLPFERFSSKQIRIGRILQLMDSLAGFSIIKFAYASTIDPKNTPFTIATACIDNIFINDSITCQQDIIIQSNVNFVGSTSAQIQVNLIQDKTVKASAFFTMVSRDPTNIGKGGRGYILPTLQFTNQFQHEKCSLRQKRGQQHRKLRLERSKKSLEATIPTTQQITILHSYFLKKTNSSSQVSISSTTTYKSLLMQSQYRNMNNKIFGGFLMKQMIQTAWIVAKKLVLGSDISFQRLEDIFFIQPVEIGEGVDIVAQAVYSNDIFVVIKVEAYKLIWQGGSRIKACQLYITFSDLNKKKIPALYPQSYNQGIQNLMGRRILNRRDHSTHD